MATTDKVKVAVRVRPFNRREIDLGTKCVVDMDDTQTILFHPSTGIKDVSDGLQGTKKAPKSFAFDHCFWSMEDSNPKFANQDKVFGCLGQDTLERAFEGYNGCIFAYGQTGSGKSYTMMGTMEQKGIIPRLCDSLFERIAANQDTELSHKVEVSYMEIYNEKVRDLLDPKGKHNLRVREHNILGPYVDGLSTLAVSSFEDIDNLMSEGNKSRTVAATNMNSESSRSHAVFNIILTQTLTDHQSGVSGEKASKLSLVDLAGSERAQKTGAVGDRLKEGSNINKSLTTLGLVISALADQGSGKNKTKFTPYRDSVLTWLLKDNLGGNSKTVMVATLSPSADNYEETLSTLRYADRAKRIVNHAVVNEDPNARIIRELREEVDMLKKMLDEAQILKAGGDLRERLEESEKLMVEMSKTWEEKMQETERKHTERHAALEKMGISVQTSGIKVEQGTYYLVNLNADPSLNELLVYYLKDHALVGRGDAPRKQDIQLSGLGIMPQHCEVDIDNHEVFITPLEGARTCVNGCTITERTRVKHGDRLLWGNNHFFRVNCPKSANSPSSETPDNIDYEYAQQELMNAQMGNDPVQEAISAIEAQHEEEKQEALDKQRMMYERQMQMLRNQLMSPSTPSLPYLPFFDPLSKMTSPGMGGAHMQSKYQQWAQERDKMFRQSLTWLKEEVVKANALVREANSLAQEMGKLSEFSVTLQIPAANLSPNRKRGTFVSEPAILVKQKGKANQVCSMENFENRIVDMRDMYEDRKEKGLPLRDIGPPQRGDPFYESQENHNLIGVANVFLEALFYNVKLDYQVPVISQQGEVAGRLHIELSRIAGTLPDRLSDDQSSEGSNDSRRNSFIESEKEDGVAIGSTIVCKVCIKEARGLPPALSNFVFCQYSFWGDSNSITVPPAIDPDQDKHRVGDRVRYDHEQEFTIHVTEEFMEHCTDGALSIEVWGNRSPGFSSNLSSWELEHVNAKSRSIMDRWVELTRKLELYVEIHELNEQGDYVAVEVAPKAEVFTGGVFQLRQGHSRRILVQVKTIQNSGTLPIICESITHVSIGCVCARSKLQKGLDSYQEVDLTVLREKWTEALDKRRRYLDEQLQRIMNKEDEEKTGADSEREKSLLDQWVGLTEERNAVLVPQAGSGIPGAPADWDPSPGMEQHIPVIFLDLNAEDMTTPNVKEGLQAAGVNSILPKEHGAKFYPLPFVKNSDKDVCALVSWDSSIHDSPHLNRVTQNNERVYLILKAVVRLSHPAAMELVLRKRLSINVYKRQSITDKLKKRISRVAGYLQDNLCVCGVTYEIVSNIPKASEDLEDRESLAQMAASQNEQNTSDGETYIEKYIRGLSAVESILTLDRLRQEVCIKEILSSSGHRMRKATSVPNIHNIVASPRGLEDKMRSDSSQDLSYRRESDNFSPNQKAFSLDALRRHGNPDSLKDSSILPNKPTGPFGLSRPNFLNLRTNIYNCKPSPKAGISPQPAKLVKPLTTLVEEQSVRETKPLLRMDTEDSDEDEFAKLKEEQESFKVVEADRQRALLERVSGSDTGNHGLRSDSEEPGHVTQTNSDSVDSDDFQDFQEFQEESKPEGLGGDFESSASASQLQSAVPPSSITHSSTTESLGEVDVPVKSFTPSMASSGYGSQAVSTQTLSSEDSASVRSISTDDTPDLDAKRDSHHSKINAEKCDSCEELAGDCDSVIDLLSTTDSKPVLARSGSLIDTDVPSNLGSPLQPTPTVDCHNQSLVNALMDQQEQAEEVTEKVTDEVTEEARRLTGHEQQKSQNSITHEDPVINAEITTETQPEQPHSTEVKSDSEASHSKVELKSEVKGQQDDSDMDSSQVNAHLENNSDTKESTPNSEVKLRKKKNGDGEEKTARRRSWNDRSERTTPTTIPEDSTVSSAKVKMRKSTSAFTVDSTKSQNLKPKVRSGDKAKSGTTPMKATYRPMSMPAEMVELEDSNSGGSKDNLEQQQDSDNEDDGMSICSFGSRADLHRLGEVPVPSWIQVGEHVIVLFSHGGSKTGTVQFVGNTEFATGNWIGVALDTPDGKNDGSVKGVRYFKSRSRYGLFVRHDKLIMDKKKKVTKTANKTSSLRRSTGNLASSSPQSKEPGAHTTTTASSFMKPTAASSAKHKPDK